MNHEPPKANNEHEEQQELERDLEALQAALVQQEDDPVSRAEPPELVDQAVLNTARRDLEGKRKRPLRWLGGFATATVVVLAVSVVLQQEPPLTKAPLTEPVGLEKRDIVKENSILRRQDGNTVLEEEQSLLPAAEPEAQRRQAKRTRQEMGAAASPATDQLAAAAPATVQAEEFRMMSDSIESQAPAEAPLHSADEWLARLLELQKSGQTELLEDELASFLEHYPDYPLPEELVPEKP